MTLPIEAVALLCVLCFGFGIAAGLWLAVMKRVETAMNYPLEHFPDELHQYRRK